MVCPTQGRTAVSKKVSWAEVMAAAWLVLARAMTHTLSKKDPILQAVNAITNSRKLEMITCTNHLEQIGVA